MRRIRLAALLLTAAVLLHTGVFSVNTQTHGTNTLWGKTFLVLGDSYTAGHGLEAGDYGWTSILEENFHMTQYNYSISGSTIADGDGGRDPMIQRYLDLPTHISPDFLILQGGSNDWARCIPIGDPTDRRSDTFLGAINLLLDELSTRYPHAVLVCFTPWISADSVNVLGLTPEDYTAAMCALCQSRDVLCYDASNTAENGIYMDDPAFRAQYCMSASDQYHLNPAGHALFAPVMGAWLSNALYGTSPADRFYDLQAADDGLKSAVSTLLSAGILNGTSDHLFSPTRIATRQTLAVTLYRMAGSPAYSGRALTDVSEDSFAYGAICWAMDAQVFSPGDSFSPNQTLTRQMLAAALYRYYTKVSGGTVTALVGLGSYPDGAEAADYAATALGWALRENVLSDRNGMLKPAAGVSRGQLALALAGLMEL